jgi:hypothetical protein
LEGGDVVSTATDRQLDGGARGTASRSRWLVPAALAVVAVIAIVAVVLLLTHGGGGGSGGGGGY